MALKLFKNEVNPFMYAQNSVKNKKFTNLGNFLGNNSKISVHSGETNSIQETEGPIGDSTEGLTVSNIKQNVEKRNFICVQSPTGSGKSYHMCHNAANLAQLGKTVILAFPNKNLLNENVDFLKSILNQPERIIHDTEICVLTLEEGISGRLLHNRFCKGNVIIVTLHAYLLDKGDFKNFTDLSYFIYLFSNNVYVFIDEGHLYLNSCEKTHNLNNLYYEARNGVDVLTSNQPFTNKIKSNSILKTLQVSEVNLKYKNTQYNGVEIINPNYIINSNINPILSEEDLKDKIFQNSTQEDYGEEPQNGAVYPEIFDLFNLYVSAKTRNQPELSGSGENYQISQTLKMSKKPFFRNSNFEAYRVKLNNLSDSHIFMKKCGVEKMANIFLINTCFTFLQNTKDDRLMEKTFKFFQNVKDAQPNLSDPNFLNSLENMKLLGLTEFEKNLSNLKGTINEKSPNYLTKMKMLQHFQNIWEEFLISYSKMVLKFGVINFKEIHPYDVSDAITANYLTSSNAYIVTFFPSLNNKPIKNFEDFKKFLSSYHETKNKNPEKKNQEDSNNLESSSEDSNESLTEEDSSESSGIEGEEKNSSENSPSEGTLKFPSSPIFTSTLNYTNMWPLLLLLQNKRTVLLSATYSLPNSHSLHENLPSSSSFFKLNFPQPKLKRAFVFHTKNDYYSSSKSSWKTMWGIFGNYFYENLTKLDGVLGLLITPSNRWAQNFYKNNLPTKKPFYSLVTSTKEAYGGVDDNFIDESSFDPSGSLKTRYCLRVCSVYSTVSVGLNLPQHKFIVCSLNNYKPSVSLSNYSIFKGVNIDTFQANSYEFLRILNER